MVSLHRLQWIDSQIRARRYPNTRGLAQEFEISRRQALRDFEYLRDSLGAPLAYRASLAAYVEQMGREFHVSPAYNSGLRAYQAWERALAAGDYEAFGLRYLTTVYAEAKGQAAAYLEFLATSWQEVQQAHAIDAAALALVKQALAEVDCA